ncbi:MAG TPA: heavy metal translocating P-type ATPase, partial [Rudaea sp.]
MTCVCFHCGEPLPSGAPLTARVGDRDEAVCCIGCRAACEWIGQLGLADYYRLRESHAARAEAVPDFSVWDRDPLQKLYVHRRGDGRAEAIVLVEGLRCAACGWLIERALAALGGIVDAGVNVSGKRVRIVWNDAQIRLGAILAAIARLGYTPHPADGRALDDLASREQRAALKRLGVAGLGMMQAMMFAIILYAGALEGIAAPTRDFFRWIGLVVTLPVIFYAAQPFFRGAWRELRAARPGMDTPVALAVLLVFVASVYETIRGGAQVYFDSASMFVFLLLGGRYLEMRARHRACDIVDALARLQPAIAQRRRTDGAIETVAVHELSRGDRVVVANGAAMPADGVLLSAECRVDESLLTGESTPQRKRTGDDVIAGSLVHGISADVRVERLGADTALAAIARLVIHAQQQQPRWARYGDRAAAWFVAALLAATALTAIFWLVRDPSRAFAASLAVLVVACPCAFALAVPAALARALAVLARRGVLVLKPNAIQALVRADHFVFDKTGTLTERAMELRCVEPLGRLDADQCLAIAAALESGNTHPIARAMARAAKGDFRAATDVHPITGGIQAQIDGVTYRIGRSDDARDSAIVLRDRDGVLARFVLGETLRDDAATALAALRAQGASVEILSGDAPARVEDCARRLGITDWRARVTPQDKYLHLQQLKRAGRIVAVVG